jgi:hypothetical protein
MSRKQWLIVAFLAIADCLVLGGLAGAVILTPRIEAFFAASRLEGTAVSDQPPTPTIPPTWTYTPTSSPISPTPTRTRRPSPTPSPTRTVIPTFTPSPTPTLTPEPVELVNAEFNDVLPDRVPGWETAAVVNWEPGQVSDPASSFAPPEFRLADDARRRIRGSTLQIQTYQWVKFNVTLYQTIEVPPDSRVEFEIYAGAYSDEGAIDVRAGIDGNGGAACQGGVWTDQLYIDQSSGAVVLSPPGTTAGPDGRVTVCFSAETQYAATHNAAFFDAASLTVTPPE